MVTTHSSHQFEDIKGNRYSTQTETFGFPAHAEVTLFHFYTATH